jgi:hypothetical protein
MSLIRSDLAFCANSEPLTFHYAFLLQPPDELVDEVMGSGGDDHGDDDQGDDGGDHKSLAMFLAIYTCPGSLPSQCSCCNHPASVGILASCQQGSETSCHWCECQLLIALAVITNALRSL